MDMACGLGTSPCRPLPSFLLDKDSPYIKQFLDGTKNPGANEGQDLVWHRELLDLCRASSMSYPALQLPKSFKQAPGIRALSAREQHG